MQEKINLFDYEYPPNHVTEIPSNNLLNIMYFCEKVLASQPQLGVPYCYPDNVDLKRNKDGGLEAVNIEWKPYGEDDKQAFFASMDNAIPVATELSVLAEQVHFAYGRIHQEMIEKGIAKLRVELTKKQEDESVSQLLAKPNKGKK